MRLFQTINEDMKAAMKSRDKISLEALRAAKTAFTLAKTETGANHDLSDEDELKIIQKLVKQRRESAAIYQEQNRSDLFEKEIAEAEVLEKYLPAKLSPEDLRLYLEKLIRESGASGMQDMGRIMGSATKDLAGRADGKDISAIVREILSK